MPDLMGEVARDLVVSVTGAYNVAWALSIVLVLTRFDGRAGLPLLLVCRVGIALVTVWVLGTLSDVVFPNSITWTVLPACVCGLFFRDWRRPARMARLALLMCAWMYSLAVAELVNRIAHGGIVLASAVSLLYMVLLVAVLAHLERRVSLDRDDLSLVFVVPVLVVCASGLMGRAILILRSDFGMEPYSVSTLESILTCLNGQLAELVVYWGALKLVGEVMERSRLQEERHLVESRYEALVAYRESGERLRQLRHEVKNQYAYIRMLLEEKDYERAQEFFGEMSMRANPTFSRVNSGNDLVDDIVNLEISKAVSRGVEVSPRIAVPTELPFDEVDLCSLLTNLLDNAIEACADTDERVVRLGVVADQGTLLVTVSNRCDHAPRLNERGLPATTKAEREGHGYGTSIVRDIAEKYDGAADFSYEGGTFVAKVMLALPASGARE